MLEKFTTGKYRLIEALLYLARHVLGLSHWSVLYYVKELKRRSLCGQYNEMHVLSARNALPKSEADEDSPGPSQI